MARGRHLQHVASSTAQQFAPRLQRLVLHAVRRLHHLRRPGTLGGATRARLCPPHSKATGCSKHGWFATTFRASAAAVRSSARRWARQVGAFSALAPVQRVRIAQLLQVRAFMKARLGDPASRRARTAAPAAAFAVRLLDSTECSYSLYTYIYIILFTLVPILILMYYSRQRPRLQYSAAPTHRRLGLVAARCGPARHMPQGAFAFAAPAVPGGRGARRARPARRNVLLARRRPRLRPRTRAPRARPSRI